jgi:hypothetical protein
MARKLRVEYLGAIYPVMNRGERLEMGAPGYVTNRLYRWRKGVLK